MLMLQAYDATHEGRTLPHPPIQLYAGTDGLSRARNSIMAHWLDKTDAEWLFMIDTDMGFPADAVDRLIDAADVDARPVVGALCFGLKRESDPAAYGGYATRPFPTIYYWGGVEHSDGTHEPGFAVSPTYLPDTVLRVDGTGAACLLVHRSAAQAVREAADGKPEWFDHIRYKSGTVVSEDLSFCYRLGNAGIPVYVHTGVKTVHVKSVWVGEEYYLADRAFRAFTTLPAPPTVLPAASNTSQGPPTVVPPAVFGTAASGPLALGGYYDPAEHIGRAVPIPDSELDDPAAIHARVALAQLPETENLPLHLADCAMNTIHHLTCTCGGPHYFSLPEVRDAD